MMANSTTWSKERPGPGRTPGARNKLQRKFLEDLTEVWEKEGIGCIRILAKEDPGKLVAICAGLMPRELMIETGPIGELSDEEIDQILVRARAQMLAAPKQEPRLVGSEKADECLELKPNGKSG